MTLLAALARQYTGEALIQVDFVRQNPGVTAPAAAVEASALVESDVAIFLPLDDPPGLKTFRVSRCG